MNDDESLQSLFCPLSPSHAIFIIRNTWTSWVSSGPRNSVDTLRSSAIEWELVWVLREIAVEIDWFVRQMVITQEPWLYRRCIIGGRRTTPIAEPAKIHQNQRDNEESSEDPHFPPYHDIY